MKGNRMEERVGYFQKIRTFVPRIRKAWLRHKIDRAIRLMEKPELSLLERIERDKVVKWLGRKGGWEGSCLLKEWAATGDVMLRPDPDILGIAIARAGEDRPHLHLAAHASVNKNENFNTRYYFARLLAVECRMLGEAGYEFNPKKSITQFICCGADKMLMHLVETNSELIKKFEKERKC